MDHFEPGRANVMIGGKNFRTVHEGNWNPERRIEDMQASGVDAEVISPLPELTSYWFDGQDGLDMCRYVNEFVADLCRSGGSRFYGLGIVPLQSPEEAAAELSEVRKLGLAGVELGTHVNGASLGDERFLEFFREVERQDLAVFVHSSNPTFGPRIGPRLFNSIGYPTETGLTIGSLIDGGTAAACPNLRIAFSHGGGTFPFILPRLQNAYSGTWNEEPISEQRRAQITDGRLPPVELARRFYYDTLVFDRRSIRYLLEVIGHRQLLIGTDYPYVRREDPVGKTLRSMQLGSDIERDITSANCLRFLGIEDEPQVTPTQAGQK